MTRQTEIDLVARSRAELDIIASALKDAPPLDRAGQRRELHPYNSVASSGAAQKAILKIVTRRDPGNQWIAVYRALEAVDDAGNGFNVFTDMYRDAAFQCGVEYAIRSLPDWWAGFLALDADTRATVAAYVRAVVAAKGGQ